MFCRFAIRWRGPPSPYSQKIDRIFAGERRNRERTSHAAPALIARSDQDVAGGISRQVIADGRRIGRVVENNQPSRFLAHHPFQPPFDRLDNE